MAHFAQMNADNVVVNVLVVDDAELYDARFTDNESEAKGIAFLESVLGAEVPAGTYWKQTSYNSHGGAHDSGKTPLRFTYAAIGMIYDSERDVFRHKKGPKGWTLDSNGQFQPPTPEPDDGDYYWEATTETWELIVHPEDYVA